MAAARVASRELTERFWMRSPSGFGTSMDPYLLVEWACRNREEHHCSDGRGEDVLGWTARGLLLLAKLRGPQQPQVHISHHRCPARTQVHQVSLDPCFVGAVGSSNYPRVTVRSYGQIDRWTLDPYEICGDRHRFGRMQRQETRFGDPIGPRAVCIQDPKGQILPHRSPRTADPNQQRHTAILQTSVLRT